MPLAGEADDTRKSSILAYIQNTTIRREGDKMVVEFPTAEELRAAKPAGAASAAGPGARQARRRSPRRPRRRRP